MGGLALGFAGLYALHVSPYFVGSKVGLNVSHHVAMRLRRLVASDFEVLYNDFAWPSLLERLYQRIEERCAFFKSERS